MQIIFLEVMTRQNRQAIPGAIFIVMIIAITIIAVSLIAVGTTDVIKSQFSNDSIKITKSQISNTYTESYLTVTVKNDGSESVNNLEYAINGFEDGSTSSASFVPSSVQPADSISITVVLSELIPKGQPMIVTASGNTTSGSYVEDTVTVSP